jgi:hypothetical protein
VLIPASHRGARRWGTSLIQFNEPVAVCLALCLVLGTQEGTDNVPVQSNRQSIYIMSGMGWQFLFFF